MLLAYLLQLFLRGAPEPPDALPDRYLARTSSPSIPAKHIFVRQDNTSCTSSCSTGFKCCGGTCIESDLTCCPDNKYWCSISGDVCCPCPAGQTCYDNEGLVAPWTCGQAGGTCVFTVSSGGGLATITAGASSAQPPPSSTISTPSPLPTTSPQDTPQPPPTPIIVVTSTVQPQTTNAKVTPSVPPPSNPKPSTPSSSFSVVVITDQSTPSDSGIVILPTTSSTHSSIPRWHGSGPLLQGYCATPEFSTVAGPDPTAIYYIGIVGCMGDKTDCCPYELSTSTTTKTLTGTASTTTTDTETGTTTVTSFTTQTASVTNTATVTQAGPSISTDLVFPTPDQADASTLAQCPDDYVTISSVCCPSGYQLWGDELGGLTPCYSTLASYLTPPPIVEPTSALSPGSTSTVRVTSTVVNVVYARNYPVAKSSSLTTGAKAGVGVGVGVGSLALIGGLGFLASRWRRGRGRPLYPSTVYAPSTSPP